MDDKVVDWVDKVVDKEYRRNQKKYDAFGFCPGRMIAHSVVSERLLKFMGDPKNQSISKDKAKFIISAQAHAERFENYFAEDQEEVRVAKMRVLIEKRKKQKKGKTKNENYTRRC